MSPLLCSKPEVLGLWGAAPHEDDGDDDDEDGDDDGSGGGAGDDDDDDSVQIAIKMA